DDGDGEAGPDTGPDSKHSIVSSVQCSAAVAEHRKPTTRGTEQSRAAEQWLRFPQWMGLTGCDGM
ncbi:hypothetical protein V496_10212, partial [Pseudogymnoascus sp. VKM F-4515 (FW-2607)]